MAFYGPIQLGAPNEPFNPDQVASFRSLLASRVPGFSDFTTYPVAGGTMAGGANVGGQGTTALGFSAPRGDLFQGQPPATLSGVLAALPALVTGVPPTQPESVTGRLAQLGVPGPSVVPATGSADSGPTGIGGGSPAGPGSLEGATMTAIMANSPAARFGGTIGLSPTQANLALGLGTMALPAPLGLVASFGNMALGAHNLGQDITALGERSGQQAAQFSATPPPPGGIDALGGPPSPPGAPPMGIGGEGGPPGGFGGGPGFGPGGGMEGGPGQGGDFGEGGGGGGTKVICTELHRQGYLSEDVWLADQAFGRTLDPLVLAGYHRWARPVAEAMRHSRLLTWLVARLALPWARHMAYCQGAVEQDSRVGRWLMRLGVPLCRAAGTRLALARSCDCGGSCYWCNYPHRPG